MSKTKTILLAGISIGDESKGGITDYITQKYQTNAIVRYNGGPQASHHVVNENGMTHCFSHFGSGSFRREVNTFLSSHMLIKPSNILVEAELLKKKIALYEPMEHIKIDQRCIIVTPMHKLIGRMQETARMMKHGSVGMGVGIAACESRQKSDNEILRLEDIFIAETLQGKLRMMYESKMIEAEIIVSQNIRNKELSMMIDQFRKDCSIDILFQSYSTISSIFSHYGNCVDASYLSSLIQENEMIVFEGAQGILLDYRYGFIPHITKTDTTFANADSLLQHHDVDIMRIGIMRAYTTRHGMGPLVAEDQNLAKKIPELHNSASKWQGNYRIGWFDLLMAHYSLSIVDNKLDSIVLTNLDRFDTFTTIKVCTSYEYCGTSPHLLDLFFDWERIGSKIKIIRFKKALLRSSEQQALLTQILFDCKPWDFQVFDGWKQNISSIKSYKDLPPNACKYLDFIESSLGVPISIVSVGPRTDQKFEKLSLL